MKSLLIVLAVAVAGANLAACVTYAAPVRERVVVGEWIPGHWIATPDGDRWIPGHYR